MKQNGIFVFLTIIITIMIGMVPFAYAQTPAENELVESTPESTLDSDVKDLKEKVATKVAELREENKKATAGTITTIDDNLISIEQSDGSLIDILYDDSLTTVYEVSRNRAVDYDFVDLEEGDYIIVTGPELDERITANSIYLDVQYGIYSGTITEADYDAETLTIQTPSKEEYIFESNRNTGHNMIDVKTLDLDSIRFSKYKAGDVVHIVVDKSTQEIDEEARTITYTAADTLLIPQEYFEHAVAEPTEVPNEDETTAEGEDVLAE